MSSVTLSDLAAFIASQPATGKAANAATIERLSMLASVEDGSPIYFGDDDEAVSTFARNVGVDVFTKDTTAHRNGERKSSSQTVSGLRAFCKAHKLDLHIVGDKRPDATVQAIVCTNADYVSAVKNV